MREKKISRKKWVGGILGIGLGTAVMFLPPPGDLGWEAMRLMGCMVFAVCCWVFDVLPDYVVALLMCTLWVVLEAVPFTSAFSSFGEENFWLFLGAFGLAAGVEKSGLMRRIALWVIGLFPANFKGQTMALLVSGMIVNPLIPSSAAKSILAAGIGTGISRSLDYKPYSREATGIFLMSFSSYGQSGPIFLSGNVVCFVMLGALPAAVGRQFNWGYWFMAMAVWGAVFFIGTYFSILLLYRPKEDRKVSKEYINEQREALGAIKKNEKITIVVLSSCLLFWILEPLHGISIAVVSMLGALVLFGLNVLDKFDLRNRIPWESLLFIGAILNMGRCLPELGIDLWLGQILIPVVSRFSNPFLFVLILTVIVIGVRFFIVSMNATIILFLAILIPLAGPLGIHPWVLGIIVFSAMQTWHTKYQNFTFIPTLCMVPDMVEYKDTLKMSFAYSVYTLAGVLLSIPYWHWMGLLK